MTEKEGNNTAENGNKRLRISEESSVSSEHELQIQQQGILEGNSCDRNLHNEPYRVPVHFKPGFPQLLFEDLQSENSNHVEAAMAAIATKMKSCGLAEFKEFCALGGSALLVTAVRKWCLYGGIQFQGSRCIATMLFVCPDSLFHGLEASLHLMGWMELAAEAMNRFSDLEDLQCCSIGSLGNLYSKNFRSLADPKIQALARFVNALDGIGLVAAAMRRFPNSEGVQEESCWLLSRLCSLGYGNHPLMGDLAHPLVSSAMQRYPHNQGLAASARIFIGVVR